MVNGAKNLRMPNTLNLRQIADNTTEAAVGAS